MDKFESGFALMTIKLDLGLAPVDCYVDVFRSGKVVGHEDLEVGAFNDLGDVMDLARNRIAQRYVWHELWR